jgi:carbonic anhydrase/acetyltransferase-like protein (isoleucine patch superfamily)/ketosteroid isomerase-like protein
MAMIRHRGHLPEVDPSAYVAPTATLVGNVTVGPRARIMYGAVVDAEGSRIEIGEASVICENVVLRASAASGTDQPVVLGDHVFVGPHSTLLGCTVGRCAYLATAATVLQTARLGAGAVVAVGGFVHARAVVPDEFFVPPHTLAAGDPVRVLAAGDPAAPEMIRDVGFASVAFGVEAEWTDRIKRYERTAEVRVSEFGAHADDVQDSPVDFRAAAERWAVTWTAAWRSHDVDAVVALYAEDCVHRSAPFRSPHQGRAGVREYVTGAFADESAVISVRFGVPVVDGDRASVEYWTTFRDQGGAPLTLAGCAFAQFNAAGLITEARDYWHTAPGHISPPDV